MIAAVLCNYRKRKKSTHYSIEGKMIWSISTSVLSLLMRTTLTQSLLSTQTRVPRIQSVSPSVCKSRRLLAFSIQCQRCDPAGLLQRYTLSAILSSDASLKTDDRCPIPQATIELALWGVHNCFFAKVWTRRFD